MTNNQENINGLQGASGDAAGLSNTTKVNGPPQNQTRQQSSSAPVPQEVSGLQPIQLQQTGHQPVIFPMQTGQHMSAVPVPPAVSGMQFPQQPFNQPIVFPMMPQFPCAQYPSMPQFNPFSYGFPYNPYMSCSWPPKIGRAHV